MDNAQKMELQFYLDTLDLVRANWDRCNEVMEPEELAKSLSVERELHRRIAKLLHDVLLQRRIAEMLQDKLVQ